MGKTSRDQFNLKANFQRSLKTRKYLNRFKFIADYKPGSTLRRNLRNYVKFENQTRKQNISKLSPKRYEDTKKNIWQERLIDNKVIYIHSMTGMSSFNPPIQTSTVAFLKRNPVLPKGLSPNQNFDFNCITSFISNQKENNLFQIPINNQINNSLLDYPKYFGNKCLSLTKDNLKRMNIIGQFDHKFITAIDPVENLIVIFDQHAISERILLERFFIDNMDGNGLKKHCLNRFLTVELTENTSLSLCKYDNYFNKIGFKCSYSYRSITFETVPHFLYKYQSDEEIKSDLYDVIIRLIEEFKQDLTDRKRVSVPYPRVFQRILAGKACRKAIKFGDRLSHNDCKDLLKNLLKCDLPFQCAHGRPSVVPLNFIDGQTSITLKPSLNKYLNCSI